MTQNRFDQASRYTAKLDPPGFLAWLFGTLEFPFRDWLDTRTLPFPGDAERTCDTVAWLAPTDEAEPWAVAIEFNLEPDATMFGRLLVYLGRLWLERRPGPASRFRVAAAVVNLTGQGQASRDMQLGKLRTCLQVGERNLAQEDAAALLDSIAAGTTARCVLPWVPLLRGGDGPGIIERWQELARAEPDAQHRGDYAGLAIVFAEAAGRRDLWAEALKEWNMVESQAVLEWMAQAQAKTLLRLLAKKFPPGAPADMTATIRDCKDGEQLARWSEAILDAGNLDDFRKAMK